MLIFQRLSCFLLASLLLTQLVGAQESRALINPETGENVTLIEAYWNANVDIANRKIQCEYFEFDLDASVFIPTGTFDPQLNASGHISIRVHRPLPVDLAPINSILELPTEGNTEDSQVIRGWGVYPVWTVSQGVYIGNTPLAASRFVEFIAKNAQSLNAVRLWSSDHSYFECFDQSGSSFLPTGAPESVNTDLVDLQDFNFEYPKALSAGEEYPTIVRRDTGDEVEFVRGLWSYNSLALHYHCGKLGWNEQTLQYEILDHDDYGVSRYYHPYNGGENVIESINPFDETWISSSHMSIADVELPASNRCDSCGFELTDTGYRLWESAESYFQCTTSAMIDSSEPIAYAPNNPLKVSIEPLRFLSLDSELTDTEISNAGTVESGRPDSSEDNSIAVSASSVSSGGGAFGFLNVLLFFFLRARALNVRFIDSYLEN